MRNSRVLALAAASVLALAAVAVALAQDGLLAGMVQPLVVHIEQQVPVDVTLAIALEDGTVVTATAPITVGIALQVNIDGAGVVSVAAGEAELAAVTTEVAAIGDVPAATTPANADGQLVDLEGMPYTVDSADDIAIVQVRSKESLGMTSLVGELRNDGDQAVKYVTLTVKFYDADGYLLDVGSGAATIEEIEPGATSAFRVIAPVELKDVASYSVEIRS